MQPRVRQQVQHTDVPRVRLGNFPTPLKAAPDLGKLLHIDDLWVKRDDLTGYSWGGNKIRTIEFLLGEALHQRADAVVVCGGPTSNFAALMASACAQHDLTVHHVSYGSPPERPPPALAVSLQSGAEVVFTESWDRQSMEARASAIACELEADGKRAYVVPRGGATAVGALGYACAAHELNEQLEGMGIDTLTVVIPVGSGGTIAGLIAGWQVVHNATLVASGIDIEIIGVSVSRPPHTLQEAIEAKAMACARLVEPNDRPVAEQRCRWRLVDGRGTGFGMANAEESEMITAVARHTRFLADSTYNAKALNWLQGMSPRPIGPVVYWHTGGLLGTIDLMRENAR